ncbi:hypothetical protein DCC81_10255 [Chitinophaga parva]|uniref:histidine kinase n=1 Tax=Chitinophaga parva TaxID=2169414 RepID=A0A2T7BEL3_9BACT|nr:ATP-binding protein [Chitinophaga parva]PUZ24721.1 hypothetical protein DCC81_10255 [Chitinophaga parva]
MEPTSFITNEGKNKPASALLADQDLQRLALADEPYFRQILTILPVAIYTVDASGLITFYNEKAIALWGRRPQPGEHWCGAAGLLRADTGLPYPEDALPLKRVLHTGEPLVNEECVVIRPDGSRRRIIPHMVPLVHPDGSVQGAINMMMDVTAQRSSEAALAEKEALLQHATEAGHLRQAIDAAEMGTWVLDLQTSRLHPSERYRDILGTDVSSGWHLDDLLALIHVNDRQVVYQATQTAVQEGRLDFEVRLIRPDGHLRWIKVNGVTTYNEQHEAVRIIGTVMNVTEQRRARRELESLVQARTKALQESNELLEKSNSALAQFAYIASHDLQEPLRKIQTFADLLGRNLRDGEAAGKYLEKICSSAARMSNLIQDVLNYSRLAKSADAMEAVDLSHTLEAVLSDFELLIAQKHALIKTVKLPVVRGFAPQLHQLFANLVGNALKFSTQEPLLEISCRQVEGDALPITPALPARTYYELSFTDNGIGFDPAYAEQIFVIFQRLNSRDTFGGTGIGLALCRKIVENHGGHIAATGQEGVGATFTVLLPA